MAVKLRRQDRDDDVPEDPQDTAKVWLLGVLFVGLVGGMIASWYSIRAYDAYLTGLAR